MAMLEVLIAANLVVCIIGGVILGRWVYALKGTVDAQAATITTMKQVNETVLNVFRTLDPERFAREVNVHKQLADDRAKALVEEAQRKFVDERKAMSEGIRELIRLYALGTAASFYLMRYVPKSQRAQVIGEMKVPEEVKSTLLEFAERAPESAPGIPSLFEPLSKLGV